MNGSRDAFYEAMSRNPRMQEAEQSGGLTGATLTKGNNKNGKTK